MLSMGLAARVLKDWFGPESLRRLQVRFAKAGLAGDVLTLHRVVAASVMRAASTSSTSRSRSPTRDGVTAVIGEATAAVG